MMSDYLRSLWRMLFPSSCLSCGSRLLSNEQYVCTLCTINWPRVYLGHDVRDNEVVRRYWGTFPAESAAAAFSYFPGGELTRVIHTMKYRNRPDLCRFMGRLMAATPQIMQIVSSADVLVPVPVSKERRRERGYNQSELLCEGISSVAHLPVRAEALRRVSFVESQTALSRAERVKNVKGAFALGDVAGLEGRHVVLVDDILTTGSTTLECLHVLGGVRDIKVSIVALALTNGQF